MKEIYKNLGFLGYPNYEVSNLGNVKSLNYHSTGKTQLLKPEKIISGYLRIPLSKNNKKKRFLIHRLVAMAFIPNPNNLPEINHINENKTDNRVNNLEYCTAEYNANYGTRKERIAEKMTNNEKTSKPVKQYDLKGNLIQKFPSIMDAQRKFGYVSQNISKVCLGERKTANGYRWSYA